MVLERCTNAVASPFGVTGALQMFTVNLNPCHTRVASLQRFKKMQIAEVHAVQTPATLWKRCAIA